MDHSSRFVTAVCCAFFAATIAFRLPAAPLPIEEEPKLKSTFSGHRDYTSGVTFSPDGKTVASASSDKTIKLWDVATGKCLTLEGHTEGVSAVAISPDGKTVASSCGDRTVKLWEAETGTCVGTLKGHLLGVFCVAFSPDGKTVASGSVDGTIKFWDTGTYKELASFQAHPAGVRSLTFSPDGKTLATGGNPSLDLGVTSRPLSTMGSLHMTRKTLNASLEPGIPGIRGLFSEQQHEFRSLEDEHHKALRMSSLFPLGALR